MNSYVILTTVAAVIGVFMRFRKFKFHQENREIDSSSLSPSSSLTTSSSDSVAPSSSSQKWTHDVFPSFRGEDVRIDFLSHIHKEFQRKGITPFIDNEIKRGESIGPELIRAIRGSKIAIILLSRNYASSKWCLDELVEIMNCREEFGQTVITIFYKVDPSDVKKLTGDFGKVFRKTCAGKSKENIKRWKEALAKMATIAGYHSSNWNNEAAMIETIATNVSNELINHVPSNDFNSLIGMRSHMKNIEPFLSIDSDEVRMIGIWGPSGIGKSTIARFLFSRYAPQFQLCVFMENIKRRYPKPYYDEYSAKLQLHKEFLSQLISQENVKISHLGVAQDRLKDKRVLVVLDDVDHLLQLDAMAKETRWFGPGSRIIITTQDKKILKAYGINHIYQVGFPADEEALQIFCMYAFGQKSPHESFENLAWEATNLCGNLPLGLRAIGSYFKGMSKHDWKKELPRLIRDDTREFTSSQSQQAKVRLGEQRACSRWLIPRRLQNVKTLTLSNNHSQPRVIRTSRKLTRKKNPEKPYSLVHYEGILAEDEKVFDTTREDNLVFSFELGTSSVIRSWDIALKTMKVGEVAKITCKPEYAYGRAGSPPDIPPDATLIFEVELVACRPRKGASVGSVSEERARLDDLKKQREIAAAAKEDDKKKREEAKAAAAARIQAKLDSKKGQGKGKGKGKSK